MYAETFNVPYTLETAAKWVSWADDAKAKNFRTPEDEGERATRYNLAQFWAEKAARWNGASELERAALEKLDAFAHNILGRLESQLSVLSSTGSAQRDAHAKLAAEYQARAAIHAANANAFRLEKSAKNQQAEALGIAAWANRTVPDDRYSTAFKDAATGAVGGWMGIPLWAWGLGAAALVALLLVKE